MALIDERAQIKFPVESKKWSWVGGVKASFMLSVTGSYGEKKLEKIASIKRPITIGPPTMEILLWLNFRQTSSL